jgi:peptidyl-tRNA hydrolase, PTH1 family
MKLVVGLGNPGDKYKATRHNAGFWLVERLAAETQTVLRKDGKFQALVGRHEASGAWLVLPQSFMNSSGRPVQMMASFFKIQPADILIVHDELDLPPGTARLKLGGGIAGHNGLKDISGRLASHDYWRLRLGIGRPAEKGAAVEFVLHRPPQDERTAIDEAIGHALEVMPLVLAGDLQGAMLKLHTQEQEDKVERAQKAEQAAPPPPPAPRAAPAESAAEPAKASSVEKFGAAAPVEKARAGEPGTVERAERSAPEAAATAKPEKKGALNSLLKKFLPGTDPARKK